jgi:hypothetical protein
MVILKAPLEKMDGKSDEERKRLEEGIREFSNKIEKYDGYIREENAKPEDKRDQQSITQWRATITEWTATIGSLRAALDAEVARKRVSAAEPVEKKHKVLEGDTSDSYFWCFFDCVSFLVVEMAGVFDAYKNINVSVARSLVNAPPSGWLFGLLEGSPMFIRECYPQFFDYAMEIRKSSVDGTAGCIFIGNPGIGKSCWLNFALVRLLQMGVTVFVERMSKGDVWLFKDGKCWYEEHSSKGSLLRREIDDDKTAVYLFDPDMGKGEPTFPVKAFTIVASSPNRANYKQFDRAMAAHTEGENLRYFPCWAEEELILCNPTIEEIVRERFLIWGGIPRYVFNKAQEKLRGMLKTSISGVDLQLIERYINTPEISEDDQKKLSHMLVQYHVETPHIRGTLDFASEEIGRLVIDETLERDAQKLVSHYQWCARQQWQGPYAGHVWEYLCHFLLAEGRLELQPLDQGMKNKRNILVNGRVQVESGKMAVMKSIIANGRYFKPAVSNFPVIDSAVMDNDQVYGFQITVARRHPPKGDQLWTVISNLPKGKSFNIVWVVDPAKNVDFKAQTIDCSKLKGQEEQQVKKVKQWRLCLKFPTDEGFGNILNKYKQ